MSHVPAPLSDRDLALRYARQQMIYHWGRGEMLCARDLERLLTCLERLDDLQFEARYA